ncbi:MAG: class I SAM-dependent methyltransferase [Spirochaetia bacterium]|nr:class I SAM-dependent methyltransferase [Spirochaetia bacterium]
MLKLLTLRKDDRVLDLGCGQGVFARNLAKMGCDVTGVDASPSLIQSAIQHSKNSNDRIKYVCLNAERLTGIKDSHFDALIAILTLQNMKDLPAVSRECARVMKPRGRMVWVINHPCLRIPRQSSWGWDEGKKMQYRRLDIYKSSAEIPIRMHPGKKDSEDTVSFHRSLSEMLGAAFEAGFVLNGMEEWCSNKKSAPGPRSRAEDRARNEFPLFAALSFRKAIPD